ncbi:hypothetical protein TNCV_2028641 [Trichonephila clavipes]|nr:hypothetical protein TNCV_2028641 [Trichonephila clavipes]
MSDLREATFVRYRSKELEYQCMSRHYCHGPSVRLWGLEIRVYFHSPLKEEDGICKVDKVFNESVVS